jgi:hypothetical protein
MIRLLITALLVSSMPAAAQTIHTPARGSAERRAILDALRPSMEAKFRSRIEFVPSVLCVQGTWALVFADGQRPGGGELPWRNAMDPEWHETGGHEISAVLRFRNGRWNLVESAIGATDVWYENLIPRSLQRGCGQG